MPQSVNLFWTQIRKGKIIKNLRKHQICNHFDGIGEVAQKSQLFLNMQRFFCDLGFDPFHYMPETHLITLGDCLERNEQYQAFLAKNQQGDIWIYKPGQSSNRGNGIKVFDDLKKLTSHVKAS